MEGRTCKRACQTQHASISGGMWIEDLLERLRRRLMTAQESKSFGTFGVQVTMRDGNPHTEEEIALAQRVIRF